MMIGFNSKEIVILFNLQIIWFDRKGFTDSHCCSGL